MTRRNSLKFNNKLQPALCSSRLPEGASHGTTHSQTRHGFCYRSITSVSRCPNQTKNTIVSQNLCGSKAILPLLVTMWFVLSSLLQKFTSYVVHSWRTEVHDCVLHLIAYKWKKALTASAFSTSETENKAQIAFKRLISQWKTPNRTHQQMWLSTSVPVYRNKNKGWVWLRTVTVPTLVSHRQLLALQIQKEVWETSHCFTALGMWKKGLLHDQGHVAIILLRNPYNSNTCNIAYERKPRISPSLLSCQPTCVIGWKWKYYF